MIQRSLAFFMLLVLAACGNTASPEATPEASAELVAEASPDANPEVVAEASPEFVAESTEASTYQFAFDTEHSTPLNWGGSVTFTYPSTWRLQDTSQNGLRGEITIFGPDNYSFSVAFNNDTANNTSSLENVLNMLNQTATIETTEREGRTLYYTPVRGGHALAAGIYFDGTAYAIVEIVNSGQRELEPILETAFTLLLSAHMAEE